MTNKLLTGKDVKGSGNCLFQDTIPIFDSDTEETHGKPSVRISRPGFEPSTSWIQVKKHCHLSQLARYRQQHFDLISLFMPSWNFFQHVINEEKEYIFALQLMWNAKLSPLLILSIAPLTCMQRYNFALSRSRHYTNAPAALTSGTSGTH
jgi:hypothetical protein